MKNTLFLSLLLLQILQFVASQESDLHKCDGLFIPLNIKSHSFVTIHRYDFGSPIVITSDWSTLNATSSSMDPILFPVPTDGRKSGIIRVEKEGQEICSVQVNFLRPERRRPRDITSVVLHKTTCCGFTRYGESTELTVLFAPGAQKVTFKEIRENSVWCSKNTTADLDWNKFLSHPEMVNAVTAQSWAFSSPSYLCDAGKTNITVTINYGSSSPVTFRDLLIAGCGAVVETNYLSYEASKLLQYLKQLLPADYRCTQ